MGLDFAIEELYGSGWSALDSAGCDHHTDGRPYPRIKRVTDEMRQLGYELSIRHIQLFDCYRAAWTEIGGEGGGAVVGRSEAEAAVYALSQARRQMATA